MKTTLLGMDFHGMKRKALQSLCKKHNLPANSTNLDMADALSSLLNKAHEEIKTKPPSCLKGSGGELAAQGTEIGIFDSKKVVKRASKKVRFLIQEETPRGEMSFGKVNVGRIPSGDEVVEEKQEMLIRTTRSLARKLLLGDVTQFPIVEKRKGRKARKSETYEEKNVNGDGEEKKNIRKAGSKRNVGESSNKDDEINGHRKNSGQPGEANDLTEMHSKQDKVARRSRRNVPKLAVSVAADAEMQKGEVAKSFEPCLDKVARAPLKITAEAKKTGVMNRKKESDETVEEKAETLVIITRSRAKKSLVGDVTQFPIVGETVEEKQTMLVRTTRSGARKSLLGDVTQFPIVEENQKMLVRTRSSRTQKPLLGDVTQVPIVENKKSRRGSKLDTNEVNGDGDEKKNPSKAKTKRDVDESSMKDGENGGDWKNSGQPGEANDLTVMHSQPDKATRRSPHNVPKVEVSVPADVEMRKDEVAKRGKSRKQLRKRILEVVDSVAESRTELHNETKVSKEAVAENRTGLEVVDEPLRRSKRLASPKTEVCIPRDKRNGRLKRPRDLVVDGGAIEGLKRSKCPISNNNRSRRFKKFAEEQVQGNVMSACDEAAENEISIIELDKVTNNGKKKRKLTRRSHDKKQTCVSTRRSNVTGTEVSKDERSPNRKLVTISNICASGKLVNEDAEEFVAPESGNLSNDCTDCGVVISVDGTVIEDAELTTAEVVEVRSRATETPTELDHRSTEVVEVKESTEAVSACKGDEEISGAEKVRPIPRVNSSKVLETAQLQETDFEVATEASGTISDADKVEVRIAGNSLECNQEKGAEGFAHVRDVGTDLQHDCEETRADNGVIVETVAVSSASCFNDLSLIDANDNRVFDCFVGKAIPIVPEMVEECETDKKSSSCQQIYLGDDGLTSCTQISPEGCVVEYHRAFDQTDQREFAEANDGFIKTVIGDRDVISNERIAPCTSEETDYEGARVENSFSNGICGVVLEELNETATPELCSEKLEEFDIEYKSYQTISRQCDAKVGEENGDDANDTHRVVLEEFQEVSETVMENADQGCNCKSGMGLNDNGEEVEERNVKAVDENAGDVDEKGNFEMLDNCDNYDGRFVNSVVVPYLLDNKEALGVKESTEAVSACKDDEEISGAENIRPLPRVNCSEVLETAQIQEVDFEVVKEASGTISDADKVRIAGNSLECNQEKEAEGFAHVRDVGTVLQVNCKETRAENQVIVATAAVSSASCFYDLSLIHANKNQGKAVPNVSQTVEECETDKKSSSCQHIYLGDDGLTSCTQISPQRCVVEYHRAFDHKDQLEFTEANDAFIKTVIGDCDVISNERIARCTSEESDYEGAQLENSFSNGTCRVVLEEHKETATHELCSEKLEEFDIEIEYRSTRTISKQCDAKVSEENGDDAKDTHRVVSEEFQEVSETVMEDADQGGNCKSGMGLKDNSEEVEERNSKAVEENAGVVDEKGNSKMLDKCDHDDEMLVNSVTIPDHLDIVKECKTDEKPSSGQKIHLRDDSSGSCTQITREGVFEYNGAFYHKDQLVLVEADDGFTKAGTLEHVRGNCEIISNENKIAQGKAEESDQEDSQENGFSGEICIVEYESTETVTEQCDAKAGEENGDDAKDIRRVVSEEFQEAPETITEGVDWGCKIDIDLKDSSEEVEERNVTTVEDNVNAGENGNAETLLDKYDDDERFENYFANPNLLDMVEECKTVERPSSGQKIYLGDDGLASCTDIAPDCVIEYDLSKTEKQFAEAGDGFAETVTPDLVTADSKVIPMENEISQGNIEECYYEGAEEENGLLNETCSVVLEELNATPTPEFGSMNLEEFSVEHRSAQTVPTECDAKGAEKIGDDATDTLGVVLVEFQEVSEKTTEVADKDCKVAVELKDYSENKEKRNAKTVEVNGGVDVDDKENAEMLVNKYGGDGRSENFVAITHQETELLEFGGTTAMIAFGVYASSPVGAPKLQDSLARNEKESSCKQIVSSKKHENGVVDIEVHVTGTTDKLSSGATNFCKHDVREDAVNCVCRAVITAEQAEDESSLNCVGAEAKGEKARDVSGANETKSSLWEKLREASDATEHEHEHKPDVEAQFALEKLECEDYEKIVEVKGHGEGFMSYDECKTPENIQKEEECIEAINKTSKDKVYEDIREDILYTVDQESCDKDCEEIGKRENVVCEAENFHCNETEEAIHLKPEQPLEVVKGAEKINLDMFALGTGCLTPVDVLEYPECQDGRPFCYAFWAAWKSEVTIENTPPDLDSDFCTSQVHSEMAKIHFAEQIQHASCQTFKEQSCNQISIENHDKDESQEIRVTAVSDEFSSVSTDCTRENYDSKGRESLVHEAEAAPVSTGDEHLADGSSLEMSRSLEIKEIMGVKGGSELREESDTASASKQTVKEGLVSVDFNENLENEAMAQVTEKEIVDTMEGKFDSDDTKDVLGENGNVEISPHKFDSDSSKGVSLSEVAFLLSPEDDFKDLIESAEHQNFAETSSPLQLQHELGADKHSSLFFDLKHQGNEYERDLAFTVDVANIKSPVTESYDRNKEESYVHEEDDGREVNGNTLSSLSRSVPIEEDIAHEVMSELIGSGNSEARVNEISGLFNDMWISTAQVEKQTHIIGSQTLKSVKGLRHGPLSTEMKENTPAVKHGQLSNKNLQKSATSVRKRRALQDTCKQ